MIFYNSSPEKQKKPLSTKERKETKIEIERFFVLFSNIWKRRAIYMVERIEGGRDGIVEEPPIHIYYAYLKPT